MQPEKFTSALRSIGPTMTGVSLARETAGRAVIEQFEVACFSMFFALSTGKLPDARAVALTSLMQDWMERFNRLGDEKARDLNEPAPFWSNGHISEELAGLSTAICHYLLGKYSLQDNSGRKRADTILDSINDYVETTETVENWMTGREKFGQMRYTEQQRLGELSDYRGDDLAIIYRKTNDRQWLHVLMLLLADGDESAVHDSVDTFMAGVMLFQLSDDYAYAKRNKRVGKVALFVNHDPNYAELLATADDYFRSLNLSPLMTAMVKTAWLARCIANRAMMNTRTDDHYSNDELFEKINAFEKNINAVAYHQESN